MHLDTTKDIINSLIEISQIKYGLVKVGKDTLNQDILFIEKYELLKRTLNIENFDQIDLSDYPEIIQLKIMVEEINNLESNKEKKQIRLNQALKAYKK